MGNGVYARIMKMIKIGFLFTALMCVVAGITSVMFSGSIDQNIDMVEYHKCLVNVVSELQSSKDVEEIQSEYGCMILLRNNDMYESRLMEAIKENHIILDYEVEGRLVAKIIFPGNDKHLNTVKRTIQTTVIIILIAVLLVGYVVLVILYFEYERPFHKLKGFSQNVARGNLDIPLKIDKGDYFGVFTESFDLMREELKKAKENEFQANISKKELVAGLSHDMKTPIATMKATCEVLNASLEMKKEIDPTYFQDKISIISKKIDMMEQLIDNMFHATLEELQMLKVEATEQLSTQIKTLFDEQSDFISIHQMNELPEMLLFFDALRLHQVIDNIVNNACKYAGTDIWVQYFEKKNGLLITIRDDGPGVDPEEIILVTQKFYRGKNGEKKDGAGLGLYLASYFMEKMGGSFECYNDHGFVVELFLRKV